MRFTTKVTSLVAAGGAAALGVGLLAFAPGVGASFSSSATADASINVGTLACQLSSGASGVTISDDQRSATIDLGTITSSAAGQRTVPLKVKNTGSVPLATTWSMSTSGTIFGGGSHAMHAYWPPFNATLPSGQSQTEQVGFRWSELQNEDMGRSGTVTYTINCNEVPGFGSAWLYSMGTGSSAVWDGSKVTLTVPDAPDDAGAGITLYNVAAGSALPDSAPGFTTDNFGAGTPRLSISFSDGTYVVGYPAASGAITTWQVPGVTGDTDYSQAQTYASSRHLDGVTLVADTGHGAQTSNITCLQYGDSIFGSGC
jgi:hypothetical protein